MEAPADITALKLIPVVHRVFMGRHVVWRTLVLYLVYPCPNSKIAKLMPATVATPSTAILAFGASAEDYSSVLNLLPKILVPCWPAPLNPINFFRAALGAAERSLPAVGTVIRAHASSPTFSA